MARACGKLWLHHAFNSGVCDARTYGVFMQVGGFLSFNLLFPSERPDIPRLMG